MDRRWGHGREDRIRKGGKGRRKIEGGEGQRREQGEDREVEATKIAFWNVAGIERKDRDFWRGIKEWDVVVLVETWLEKKGWDKIRDKLPREFKWEAQIGNRKNRKGRAMGGMLVVGVRKGMEEIEEGNQDEVEEEVVTKMVKIRREKWRVIGIYVNGDIEGKWKKVKG